MAPPKTPKQIVIPEDLTALSDSELAALSESAVTAFQALLPEDGSAPTDESLKTLSTLADGIDAVKAEIGTRAEAAMSRSTTAKSLADRVLDRQAAEEAPGAEPVAQPAVAAASSRRRMPLAARRAAAAAAKPRPAINIDLGALSRRTTSEESTVKQPFAFAAQGAAGYDVGKPMTLDDMAASINSRLAGFNMASYQQANGRGQRMTERFAITRFRREFPEELIVQSEDPSAALTAAVNQSRIPNGLVASGGWCAPSETLYDLMEVSEADNLVSVPEIQINRGGVRHALGPKYSDVYTNSGFCYTEAEDIAGDYDGLGGGTKPCFTVPCPSFDDVRLGYCGVCIAAGMLQQRGYPELIKITIDATLNAHAHRVSAAVIGSMVAASAPVTWGGSPQAGATAPLLTAIDLQATHLRAASRLSDNAVLEIVLPTWTRSVIRADLARRIGVDLLSVSDARIDSFFIDRNINAQFVVDWQDIATTAAAAFVAPPTTVKFLLYPAGAFVKGVTDSIMMENIYDSVGLGTNDYTALFTEDPYLVLKRFHDTRVVTVGLEATGNTHIGSEIKPDGTYAPVVVSP